MLDENLNMGFVKEKERIFNKKSDLVWVFKCERKTDFFNLRKRKFYMKNTDLVLF